MAKYGSNQVNASSRGSSSAANSGGRPGCSEPQRPIPGPENPGPPASMRKALAKKSTPDRGTSFPGSVR